MGLEVEDLCDDRVRLRSPLEVLDRDAILAWLGTESRRTLEAVEVLFETGSTNQYLLDLARGGRSGRASRLPGRSAERGSRTRGAPLLFHSRRQCIFSPFSGRSKGCSRGALGTQPGDRGRGRVRSRIGRRSTGSGSSGRTTFSSGGEKRAASCSRSDRTGGKVGFSSPGSASMSKWPPRWGGRSTSLGPTSTESSAACRAVTGSRAGSSTG